MGSVTIFGHAIGDVILSLIFASGAVLCAFAGIRGLRGGPLWLDNSDIGNADPEPERLVGRGARVLGLLYFAAGVWLNAHA